MENSIIDYLNSEKSIWYGPNLLSSKDLSWETKLSPASLGELFIASNIIVDEILDSVNITDDNLEESRIPLNFLSRLENYELTNLKNELISFKKDINFGLG